MPSNDDLCLLSANDLLNAYRRREISPVDVTRAVLDRIDRLNPKLNAFLHVAHESAMASAEAAADSWARPGPKPLLLGVPVSVKDLVPTHDMPTTSGSLVFKDHYPTRDAPIVERLRAAGAVLLGKTNTPELGLIGATRNRLGDEGRNPWDLGHTCGGSSGGAGAAVAAGLGPLAVATDGAGSIRIPAAFNGCFGIKPSFGRIPTHELVGAPWSSTLGPISRTVRDAAWFLSATAGPDDRDAICLEEDPPDFFSKLASPLTFPRAGRPRVALSFDLDGNATLDPEVAEALSNASDVLRDLGCDVVQASPPVETGPEATPMNPADEYAFDPALLDEHYDELTPYAQRTLKAGQEMPAWKYAQALRRRERYRRSVARWFRDFDFFLSPSVAHPAGPVGGEVTEIAGTQVHPGWVIWYTALWNRTGNPSASIPAGFSTAGLPLAVQVTGRLGDEPGVLGLAAAMERERPWAQRWPSVANA
jgi:aspartyl-tRNA(Asn)/glutamyl-tRNA(Gln) amidotransferase subunit A